MTLYKMKQVCEMTGLTEKAVRLYVQKELIKPLVEEGIHKNSISFTEENIEELKQIVTLREADFSISEILELKNNPEQVYALVQEKKSVMEAETEARVAIIKALEHMAPTDSTRLDKVTDQLAKGTKEVPQKKHFFRNRLLTVLSLLVIIGILSLTTFQDMPFAGRFFVELSVVLLVGAISVGLGVFYLLVPKKADKHPNHTTATVLDVTQDTRFDASFALGKSIVPGAGFREQGLGGNWTFFLMLFNEIRFDNWFPLLQYRDQNGILQAATMQYGLFRQNLKAGDTLEIAYDDENHGLVYPMEAPWLIRKGLVYLMAGILLLGISSFLLPRTVKVLSSPYAYIYASPMDLINLQTDRLDGTINASEQALSIHYNQITMIDSFRFYFHEGDVIVLRITDPSGNLKKVTHYMRKLEYSRDADQEYDSARMYLDYMEGYPERFVCMESGYYDLELALNDRSGIYEVYVE